MGRAVGRFAAPAHGRKHQEDFMCGPRATMFSCMSDALIKVFWMWGVGDFRVLCEGVEFWSSTVLADANMPPSCSDRDFGQKRAV
jgi:hypothetical protein